MIKIDALVQYTQQLLQVAHFKDYCPNGLQIEGRPEIRKIVTGVTANMALLEAAYEANADLILVHHGYFWRHEDARILGAKRKRIAFLLKNDLNLMAYHLPLDAHPQLGNNVQLSEKLGLNLNGFAGENNIIAYGKLSHTVKLFEFAKHLELVLKRAPLIIGDPQKKLLNIAWCTGAAQNYIETAIELGVDLYISGEISEQTVHHAVENDIAYIAAGHHATERYGVQALGEHLAEKFNLIHTFIDILNPV